MFKIAENDGDSMMLEPILNNNVITFPQYSAIII